MCLVYGNIYVYTKMYLQCIVIVYKYNFNGGGVAVCGSYRAS